eukprot:TRINITY_DN113485_c0_g1_i1.p1 TRINITY_DN113485_c0_g1~~TRINITY_DN113485_c0_g1_i1.p1  ORF type:complete len:646 (-),score=129.05 TRINITY_DN113485_c0_g1_i1:37-1974(-)
MFRVSKMDSSRTDLDRVGKPRMTVTRKSLVDEKIKMTEKLKSYEVKQSQRVLGDIVGGDWRRVRIDFLLEHFIYQAVLVICTIISVILIALEADRYAMGLDPTMGMTVLSELLLAIFFVDVAMRMYVYRHWYFKNALNNLEAVLIAFDVIVELTPNLPNVMAALKVLRFLRLSRLLRSLEEFRELYLMMMGILASIRTLIFGTLLLFVILTMFSILAVYFVRPVLRDITAEGLIEDCYFCNGAFDSVSASNLTFLSTVVAGDSWGMLCLPLINADGTAAFVIIAAFVVINLGMLNTIAAVIVDRQAQARQQDSDYMAVIQAEELTDSLGSLQQMFREMDEAGDNSLSCDELMSYYESNEYFRSILNRLDIHKADVPVIFSMLDTDDNGDVDFAEFVNGLHSLKNENSHTLAIFTKHYAQKLHERWEDVVEILTILRGSDPNQKGKDDTEDGAISWTSDAQESTSSCRSLTAKGADTGGSYVVRRSEAPRPKLVMFKDHGGDEAEPALQQPVHPDIPSNQSNGHDHRCQAAMSMSERSPSGIKMEETLELMQKMAEKEGTFKESLRPNGDVRDSDDYGGSTSPTLLKALDDAKRDCLLDSTGSLSHVANGSEQTPGAAMRQELMDKLLLDDIGPLSATPGSGAAEI